MAIGLFYGLPRGTKTKIAKACGLTNAAVTQWKRVPKRHVDDVERVTGITRQRLRPDIYPDVAATCDEDTNDTHRAH